MEHSALYRKSTKRLSWPFMAALLAVIALCQPCLADADLEVLQRIELDAAPLDVAVSADGLWIYVLTDAARLYVYSRGGEPKAVLAVPPGARRLAVNADEDVLLVTNPSDHTVQAVRVNLVHAFTSAQSPTRGPADTPVTLTLFTDFECGYCARLAPVLDEVHRAYPEKVRIVFKNFPLRSHRFAGLAALAALAAHAQGQFWPFHDRLFENYDDLSEQKIEEIRQALGLDAERFQAAMSDPAPRDLIRNDLEEGYAAGVNGTPTVFINGRKMRGPLSFEGLREAIEAVLAENK